MRTPTRAPSTPLRSYCARISDTTKGTSCVVHDSSVRAREVYQVRPAQRPSFGLGKRVRFHGRVHPARGRAGFYAREWAECRLAGGQMSLSHRPHLTPKRLTVSDPARYKKLTTQGYRALCVGKFLRTGNSSRQRWPRNSVPGTDADGAAATVIALYFHSNWKSEVR